MSFIFRWLLCLSFSFSIQSVCISPFVFAEPHEFSGKPLWFNTEDPVELTRLQDHFVMIHFGIYSSSNADWAIPELKKLSEKYSRELVIVGVHAAKFFEESVEDDIRKTIQDLDVRYPVAVDENLATFKAFQIKNLPTVVLIAPDGNVLFKKSGGEVFRYIDKVLPKYLKAYSAKLSHQPIHFIDETKAISVKTEGSHSLSLSEKVSSDGLIGPLMIDQVEVFTSEAGYSGEPKHIIATAQTQPGDEPERPLKSHVIFDERTYVGDKIVVDREYSRQVGKLRFSIRLPVKTQLAKTVKSFVRVFTTDGTILGAMALDGLSADVPINAYINGDRVYAEVVIYYVSQVNGFLCSYKGLLYAVPLADYPKSENIELNFNMVNP